MQSEGLDGLTDVASVVLTVADAALSHLDHALQVGPPYRANMPGTRAENSSD